VGAVVAAAVVTGLLVGSALSGDSGETATDRDQSRQAEPSQRTRSAPPAVNAADLNDEGFQLMNAGRYDEAIPGLCALQPRAVLAVGGPA
jgi:hypothetical protein